MSQALAEIQWLRNLVGTPSDASRRTAVANHSASGSSQLTSNMRYGSCVQAGTALPKSCKFGRDVPPEK